MYRWKKDAALERLRDEVMGLGTVDGLRDWIRRNGGGKSIIIFFFILLKL